MTAVFENLGLPGQARPTTPEEIVTTARMLLARRNAYARVISRALERDEPPDKLLRLADAVGRYSYAIRSLRRAFDAETKAESDDR